MDAHLDRNNLLLLHLALPNAVGDVLKSDIS